MDKHRFTDTEINGVYRTIAERRDMRHFLPDPVAPDVLARLLQAAHQAGSVGLMQPWRFIRITPRNYVLKFMSWLSRKDCKLQ